MKKYLSVLIIVVLILLLTITVSMAEGESCELKLETAGSTNPGKEAELTLSVSNINAGDGIAIINGILEYDENVFETVSDNNFVSTTLWKEDSYLEGSLTIVTKSLETTKTNGDVLKITLKVKSDAKPGEYDVKFTKIDVAGDGDVLFNVNDITCKVKVVEETKPTQPENKPSDDEKGNEGNTVTDKENSDEEDKKDGTITGSKDNTANGTNKDTSTKKENTAKDNTVSNKDLSYAGMQTTGIIIGIIAILVVRISFISKI